MTKPHHLLVFSEHLPQPKASAAGRRLNEILVLFSKAGFQITHIYSSDIQLFDEVELPLYQQLKLPINNQSVQAKLKALNPSYVLFDRFVMEEKWAWRIHDLFPEAVRILDLEDLHCLRKTREFCLKNKVKYSDDILKTQEISKRELASIVRSDLTLVISKFEYDLLINTFKIPEKQLFYLPFLTDSSSKTKALTFEERKDFIWIGGYKHPPNVDAVRCLKSSIWPKIRTELPKANLH
ncbi:MAG: glycosyltransferase, partial [Flavobacteriales bacterium]